MMDSFVFLKAWKGLPKKFRDDVMRSVTISNAVRFHTLYRELDIKTEDVIEDKFYEYNFNNYWRKTPTHDYEEIMERFFLKIIFLKYENYERLYNYKKGYGQEIGINKKIIFYLSDEILYEKNALYGTVKFLEHFDALPCVKNKYLDIEKIPTASESLSNYFNVMELPILISFPLSHYSNVWHILSDTFIFNNLQYTLTFGSKHLDKLAINSADTMRGLIISKIDDYWVWKGGIHTSNLLKFKRLKYLKFIDCELSSRNVNPESNNSDSFERSTELEIVIFENCDLGRGVTSGRILELLSFAPAIKQIMFIDCDVKYINVSTLAKFPNIDFYNCFFGKEKFEKLYRIDLEEHFINNLPNSKVTHNAPEGMRSSVIHPSVNRDYWAPKLTNRDAFDTDEQYHNWLNDG